MNWKQLYKEATPAEREQILFLLMQRLGAHCEESREAPRGLPFFRARAHIHWIGRYSRPRRLERALFLLLFFLGMFALETEQFMFWSIAWGGTMAIFLSLVTLYRLVPHKRAHWIK